MKYVIRYLALATALGLLAFGCGEEPELLQAPPSGPLKTVLEGSEESLGPPGIPIATGTGVVARGIGTFGTGSGTINFLAADVPAGATVKQVLLYWAGEFTTSGLTTDVIQVNGSDVTGQAIGLPNTLFFDVYYSESFRAQLPTNTITPGSANAINISGMNFERNNGAGIVVIFEEAGKHPAVIQMVDGSDLAWRDFAPPLNACVPQTFTFAASPVARTAKIYFLLGSIETGDRPDILRWSTNVSGPDDICNPFTASSNEFCTCPVTLTIPANATSLTLEPISDVCGAFTANPQSFNWVAAALQIQLAAIGDFVWIDSDQDGCQDELPLVGVNDVTVNLYLCSDPTTVYRTMKTGSGGLAAGEYVFDELAPGEYFVEFMDLPTGYQFTLKDQSCTGGDAADSDADPTTGRAICTTLDPGEFDRTWDAGIYAESEFGDTVWVDGDCDGCQDPGEIGISGVTVNLYRCSAPSTVFASTTTSATGLYKFSGLAPGDYFAEFILPAGYAFTTPNACPLGDEKDSDADPVTGRTPCTTLTAGESDFSWDAGLVELLALGDFVWYDDDRDGCQSVGEDGVPGVTVQLWKDGGVIATTTTDANGIYGFSGLMPGVDYRVKFILPPTMSDYVFTEKDACPLGDEKDSDAAPMTGMTPTITLLCGQDDLSIDAGIYVPPIGCRMTGGANDMFDGTSGTEVYTCGGQAGASLASQPQPWGEWTHTQKRGPSGSFTFHAGTASAPPGTEIDWIECSDPGWCVQARPAPAKQLDFAGVGTFKNLKGVPPSIANYVVVGESMHWFEVNIDDLGEPGKAGKVDPPAVQCDAMGFGRHGGTALGDCDCPDFYRIRIYQGPTDASPIMYEVYGYIDGGNFQIHPPTGRDRKNIESQGGGRGK